MDGFDETRDDARGLFSESREAEMLRLRHMTAINRYVEVRSQFPTRTLGDDQIPSEVRGRRTLKAFGNVGHDGDGRSPHLIGEPTITRKGFGTCEAVYLAGQLASLWPRDQVFEPPDTGAHQGRACDTGGKEAKAS